jgi:serine-aspartate repeat-containing protein C/D/E
MQADLIWLSQRSAERPGDGVRLEGTRSRGSPFLLGEYSQDTDMKPIRFLFIVCLVFLSSRAAFSQNGEAGRRSAAKRAAPAPPNPKEVASRPADTQAAVAVPAVFGSIGTVRSDGTSQQVFAHRTDVFLAGGPLASPCQFAAFLPNGQYYFQVTDASALTLLSTDPVAERAFTVKSGVVASYDGTTHATGSLTVCGSLPVDLFPFSDAGPRDALYVAWVTPAAAFDGNPTQVDQVCGAGCFHGFHTDLSLTAAFRVEDKASCDPSFCVSGVAFNDLNGNGIRDSGELGLGGVPIRVESATGLVLTGVSADDGTFQICGLASGQAFRVTSPAPLGFNKTGPINATVAPRVFAKDFAYVIEVCMSNVPNLTFPNQPIPGAIGGLKFEDTNANGARDPGEPPLAAVTIQLSVPAGPPQTQVTDASGAFLFTNLPAGDYVLSEIVPSGFTQTAPLAGTIPITLAANGSSLNNVFGNFHGILTGTISGTKFLDVNGNGVRDAGEPGLAGVTISLTNCPSPCVATPVGTPVTTGPDGSFSFANIPLGAYFLSETVPPGFRQTAPPPPGEISATLSVAQTSVSGLLFGNQALLASVAGTKFNDINGNGVFDPGETGMQGVTIQLQSSTGQISSTTTDASGTFSFMGVAPGAYTVSEVLPPGFTQTLPGGAGTIALTLAAGDAVKGLLFGNQLAGTASIAGTKYLDLNRNGVLDDGDRPFPDVVFVLTDAAGHTQTTTSAADGTFSFTNLGAGTYVLSEILPRNTVQTFPGHPDSPATYTITLTPGQHATGYLFLNKC